MKKQIYKWLFFQRMGWKISGNIDQNIKKCVFMVIPHTSWHDFYIGVFVRGIIGLEINFVGKKELFRFPLGGFFRYMGGAALDRSGGLNKVDAIANVFKQKSVFRLAIAPEGTRKKVTELKTGFYYIALKANVPIIPVAFDYKNKVVKMGGPFYPTGTIEEDLPIILKHFIDVEGKISQNSFVVK